MELGSSGIGGVFPLRTLKSLMTSAALDEKSCLLLQRYTQKTQDLGSFPSHADAALMAPEPGFCRSSGRNGRTCRKTEPTCIFHERQRS